jgi:RND superfamily putative drug exporter
MKAKATKSVNLGKLSLMVKLARLCVRRRNTVLVAWIAILVGLGGVLGLVGSAFTDSTRLPASDSSTAYNLLAKAGSNAASVKTGTIVWHVDSGSAASGNAEATIQPMLAKVAAVDGVSRVVSPLTTDGANQLSKDGRTAYATVVFDSTAHAGETKKLAENVNSPGLTVQVGGSPYTNQIPSEIPEAIGVLAALFLLLLVFRSMWAAALPIITGVAGVAVSSLIVMLLSHVMNLSSVALSLGGLIGLGVGIDYALFIVNRQRKALREGADVGSAVITAMNTSGRAVLFAGGTVIIALLGMLVLNIGFLTGMAVAAAITVLLTVAAAVTLLPALLAKMGRKVLRRSERARTFSPVKSAGSSVKRNGVWASWARVVERRPVVSIVLALVVLIGLAAPAMSLRLGSADASSDRTGSSSRSYYDTMSNGFGAGFQSQLLLVAETPDQAARQAWQQLVTELPKVPGVASVTAPAQVGGEGLSTLTLTPTTTAQAKATSDLVHTLRSTTITNAEKGTDLQVHVGGTTATTIDFANALTSKLPLFLGIIALLGFLLLTLAFRSLLVPAIGALGNLLTIAVALGVTVALFQWGWGPSFFGIGGPAPLEYIVAILMVGVVFGLSMDYHVFLVSRMHEEWENTHDNRRSVSAGIADTGKVIATAAGIMACVFVSFGFAGVRTSAEFGVGLALAVLADAFLLRMTIIPAVMHLCGRYNWAIPAWLDRILPNVSVEGAAPTSHATELTTKHDPVSEPVNAR